mgnify:CR=1 FL=1
MLENLLEGFLLPSLEHLMVEELLSELIFCGDINYQLWIYNDCSK